MSLADAGGAVLCYNCAPRLWHRSPYCVMGEVRWRAKGTAVERRWISIYITER